MLKIKDLRKSYGTFELNCSMEIPAGCITGLVGSNGAGKSTTFKSVLGLISIDGGSIEVFGKEIHTWTKAEKQRMGVVLANGGFNTYLTMKDMETVLSRMYPRFDRAMFREYCRRYQLPADKRIKEFSTGMLAKAKILAAITHKADLLLLDEPTTGLHMSDIENLLRLFDLIVSRGNTLVVIEHNLDVMKQADWIIDIGPDGGKNGGQVVFTGTPMEMLRCARTLTADSLRASLG